MVKYDYAFKKKVVEAYQNGAGGYRTLANQFDIASLSTVRKWVKTVEKFGFNALHRRVNYPNYSSKFKRDVIHYYLTSANSYLTVALKYGLPNDTLVLTWHQKFLETGIEGLSPKQKGRPSMSKKKKPVQMKTTRTREQELEHENELLRAELAFIKKLRALGMNIPERLKNEMPESSTNSKKIPINNLTGSNQIS